MMASRGTEGRPSPPQPLGVSTRGPSQESRARDRTTGRVRPMISDRGRPGRPGARPILPALPPPRDRPGSCHDLHSLEGSPCVELGEVLPMIYQVIEAGWVFEIETPGRCRIEVSERGKPVLVVGDNGT